MEPTTNLASIEREYLEIFERSEKFKTAINKMIDNEQIRLILCIDELRKLSQPRAKLLLLDSFAELIACQNSLKRIIQNISPEYAKLHEQFYVGFEGSFGSHHVTPRTLNSKYLGTMICVEGIITKCSLVRPKVLKSVHFCPKTGKTIERRYADFTSLNAQPSSAYPTKDEEGNILETEYGLCNYLDHQSWTIQEMPEKAPAGQLPRSLDIVADNDLVDEVKPGDRVQIVGQFRCLPIKQGNFTTATFRSVLIVNNVVHLCNQLGSGMEEEDVPILRQIAHLPNVVDLLARSIAPSIHGHYYVKLAILLQLLGGVERRIENGSRIRGDINVLLLGDPSVAKSQFLRFVLYCAPRAIATTGRGSSGVGLTAAVTVDPETNERQLEAGAMVLADRGVVCIDEFDKMTDQDRTAIHEVMEQGQVTISKAGIQARLNARCSVLAAANPVWGRYNPYKSPMENIGMQDSLLSRFDLIFVLLDTSDVIGDQKIAEHVLRVHRYRTPGEADGTPLPLHDSEILLYTKRETNSEEVSGGKDFMGKRVFESMASVYGGDNNNGVTRSSRANNKQFLTMEYLQKYIQTASCLEPVLTSEASDILVQKYCELRCQDSMVEVDARNFSGDVSNIQKTQPITARTFETLIRLATAHAKARSSLVISKQDAEASTNLISYAIFKEVLDKKSGKRAHKRSRGQSRKQDGSEDSENETSSSGSESSSDDDEIHQPMGKRQNASRAATAMDIVDLDNEQTAHVVPSNNSEAIKLFLSRAFQNNQEAIKLPVQQVLDFIQSERSDLSEQEIRQVFQGLHDDCRIMLTSDEIFML